MKCAVHKACNHIRTRETWYWGGLHGNRAGDRESNVWEDLEADSSGLRGDDNVERKGCRSSFICTVKIPLEIKIEFLLWSFGFSTRVGGIISNTKCVFYIHRQEQFILRICPPRSVVHYTAESKRQSGGLFFFFCRLFIFSAALCPWLNMLTLSRVSKIPSPCSLHRGNECLSRCPVRCGRSTNTVAWAALIKHDFKADGPCYLIPL